MALTERDLESPDPLRLDRELSRAAEAWRNWRRRLRRGGGVEEDPFWASRLVTGRTAFRAVSELPAADPLREPLRAWIYRLAEQRIDRAAIVRAAVEWRHTTHVVTEPERARLTPSESLRRALAEPAKRDAWLGSHLASLGAVGDAEATLWERRREVAIRMGLDDPDAIPGMGADVVAAATRFLAATRELLDDRAPRSPGDVLRHALAEGSSEGWPRHLLPRTVLDLFRGTDWFRGLELDPGELPAPLAPASYVRALARVGAAWVDATAPHDQPFVVARDPLGLRRRAAGALFGAMPAMPAFARRALDVPPHRIPDHARALARSALLHARGAALRVLLRRPALDGRGALRAAFEAETERAFGVPFRPSLAGAVFRLHDDDPQRFAGTLLAAAEAARLRELHDEDWFRNPRAAEQLRDEARRPPERATTDEALRDGERALVATLTRAL